ncbi:hypothetical protein [Streptomyces sp. NBC_01190]|uniref:hypothetical protein n=1 Tax=Streptomyces sp. NBC_01190 TaxID=2903767 RepID=UPI003867AFE5|nr:hypothetical protein OG519_32130 [Streptomyces sp. NBC_01190]
MSNPSPRWLSVIAVVALAAGAAGCGSSSPRAGGPSTSPPANLATVPVTAPPAAATTGAGPTPATAIICGQEAWSEISGALGATPVEPLKPTWRDRLYTCAYRYGPHSAMTLSVKELMDPAAETAYFTARRHAAGPAATALHGLGDDAFGLPDGSVYVRKDLTVLRVDVSGLPARFGAPPRTRRQVGLTVATTVMLCWKEL